MPESLRSAIDAYASDQDDPPSRSEAIRLILADWLAAHGFMQRDAHDHPEPKGPATDAVGAMDAAIAKDRPRRKKAVR